MALAEMFEPEFDEETPHMDPKEFWKVKKRCPFYFEITDDDDCISDAPLVDEGVGAEPRRHCCL
jgi:hypothetical protein